MMEARSDMQDDPLMHVLNITHDLNKPIWNYIEKLMDTDDFVAYELSNIKELIANQPPTATKFHTYITMNPDLITHPLYTTTTPNIPDYLRINFTRFRLSSHRLRIEMGRWSRTPQEERVCSCGTGIQNEEHIFQCPLVKDILNASGKQYTTLADMFDNTDLDDLHLLHRMLDKLYETDEPHHDGTV